jgi:hypothetical protein
MSPRASPSLLISLALLHKRRADIARATARGKMGLFMSAAARPYNGAVLGK